MAFFSSSNLTASDSFSHDLPRHEKSGLLKNGKFRNSKQDMVEKKMFGSRAGRHGRDFRIGKVFSRGRKMAGVKMPKLKGTSKVGPSIEQFEHMMHSSVTHNPNKKRSPFFRKQFS